MAHYTNRAGQAFAAEIGTLTIRMKDRTKLVWQQSILRLVEIMQTPLSRGGHMPVDTGFLRSSLMAGTSPIAMNSMERPSHGGFMYLPTRIEEVVMGAHVGEKIYLGYEAIYARAQEYGTAYYPGHGFQRLAVQQWPSIVVRTLADIQSGAIS